jgi:hypothetical protein
MKKIPYIIHARDEFKDSIFNILFVISIANPRKRRKSLP